LASCDARVAETPDFALIERLREVVRAQPATEAELRALGEQADAWARALEGQVDGSERRLRELNADPASDLVEVAAELRRVETLRPQLEQVRELQAELDVRARELRTEWLLHQADTVRPLSD
jgi:phage-related minor tail protein